MATQRKSEQGVPSGAQKAESGALAVPRTWLIVLTGLVVLPWIIVGMLYFRGPGMAAAPAFPEAAGAPSGQAAAGPWGQLSLTPIVISPPLEFIAADWGRSAAQAAWHFPGVTGEMLEAFLITSGLPGEQAARLLSRARPDAAIAGLVVTPDPEVVRAMEPQVRARIYSTLAKSPLNFDQANSFRFHGDSAEEWLGGSLISPQTRRLVEPLIYREGEYLSFADAEYIRSQIHDPGELRRLAKVLLRVATVLVRLTIPDASRVDALADYWGRGGRRTDLRPLLESIAGAGPERSIDIVHLLPTFARNHLYRYPKLSTADLNRPSLANCLWTALNFFRSQPDDRFLDMDASLKSLKEGYYVVQDGFQLGDIVAFLNEQGDLFHVAVYLADDLVFTKNGTSPMAPWIITTVDLVKEYYRGRSANPRLIYHRRNDF